MDEVHARADVVEENWEAILVVTCPSGEVRRPARELGVGSEIPCACGEDTIVLEDDGIVEVQRQLDEIRKTAENVFR